MRINQYPKATNIADDDILLGTVNGAVNQVSKSTLFKDLNEAFRKDERDEGDFDTVVRANNGDVDIYGYDINLEPSGDAKVDGKKIATEEYVGNYVTDYDFKYRPKFWHRGGEELELLTSQGGIRLNKVWGTTVKDDTGSIHNTGEMGYFDGKLSQGNRTTDKSMNEIINTPNWVCNTNPIEVKPTDVVRVKTSKTFNVCQIIVWGNSEEYINYENFTSSNNFSYTVPTNAKYITISFGGGSAVTPSEADAISITINGNYAIVVSEVGKNLWDEKWELGAYNSTNGTKYNANDIIRSKNYISVKPNTKYYMVTPINSRVFFYQSDNTFISSVVTQGTFTTPNNAKYMHFHLNGTTYNNDIAIIEGTSGIYLPHESNTVIIPITQPMCSVNELADELVKVGGKWKEHRRLKKTIINRNLGVWVKSTSYPGGYYCSGWVENNSIPNSINHIQDTFATASNVDEYQVNTVYMDKSLSVRVDNTLYPTLESFLSYLDNNPITMIYEAKEDTYTDCIDQVPFYSLESFVDKTYVSTNERLAVLDVDYGNSDISATVLANYNTSNRVEAKLDKLLNPSALTIEE